MLGVDTGENAGAHESVWTTSDPERLFGVSPWQWRKYNGRMPDSMLDCCAFMTQVAIIGGRPLSLTACILNDGSDRAYEMASSGQLNGSQMKLEIRRALPDGGMRSLRGLHPSSVFEWMAITKR